MSLLTTTKGKTTQERDARGSNAHCIYIAQV
jgi:hypothetical protein